ncbi:hypothetical protein A3K29_00130 [Candidatus Collierbacteria bacterium RIFOXYB2_FULL_46_14]|uniref:Uncharacterized protein n=1 Tax=Candidatus Collierbacteria bacterium GW2011_GWA2_46_26 TaxID=1618381 RepID=A0A0G1SJY9_9BACT|nr:MAG: hypothetical protein UW29_C0001G0003 [Candidatus Collierbacteria bacterium GW2011_GWC2_44_13]KKU33595.1 MAG: hypothetical protein UX47_C0002G0003 [Candidatus Collierbacteria bacterium GW2011_GWA2_46_26]OGD72545.1 MAG: hypothetical protein A3K29_00130 [Candidatus Collierbacteria bacterium RIFOXYB2_FULL_46_14]OGD75587.1 MAG: hypothetical protein A3K43_00130 [Candidatus Collierbacteria bacterium RIFOXYA2_FULL_46_20]OGD76923.1 MAG: hypothetical protein A3K39_00130 [Candidatus Collierbacteri
MDESNQVRFVPANPHAGYYFEVLIIEAGNGNCLIRLVNTDIDHFLFLMGGLVTDNPARFPMKIDGVLIRQSSVPENEIEFSRGKVLGFKEAIEFMKTRRSLRLG